MSKYFYLIVLMICLILLAGCFPVPEPPIEPIPCAEIYIIPEISEIGLGKSVELFCYDQLDRPVIAEWSKRCNAGTLSNDLGVSCIYTTPKTMGGWQMIYADYKGLRAIAKVNGVRR